MLGHQREDDIVEDYCDSRHAKGHPLFSNGSALQIFLYYDEAEICNPIGHGRTKHKLGIVCTVLEQPVCILSNSQ